MPEARTIEERLQSVEQALTAQEDEVAFPDADIDPEALSTVESRVVELERRLTELESGLQALRGYVGNVNHVNETVERRANAAIAAVERMETAAATPPRLATVQRPEEGRGEDGVPSNVTDPETSSPTETDETESSPFDRIRTLL